VSAPDFRFLLAAPWSVQFSRIDPSALTPEKLPVPAILHAAPDHRSLTLSQIAIPFSTHPPRHSAASSLPPADNIRLRCHPLPVDTVPPLLCCNEPAGRKNCVQTAGFPSFALPHLSVNCRLPEMYRCFLLLTPPRTANDTVPTTPVDRTHTPHLPPVR